MGEFNFCGGSYLTRSLNGDSERAINCFPEPMPGGAKSKMAQYGTPGLAVFAALPDKPLRGLYSPDGGATCYAVAGAGVYGINADGTFTLFGLVERATTPAQMFANGTQLMIFSGLNGYCATGTEIVQVTPGYIGGYCDGYDIAVQLYSQQFNISALFDGLSWDPLDNSLVRGGPDHVISALVNNREIWFFCSQHVEVWDDSGNADFPFSRNPSGFLEEGCIAPWSPKKFGGSLYWLGSDERSSGILWQAVGYAAKRVSTPAVEYAWARYSVLSDAVAWTYEAEGHSFYMLWFPTADKTWGYDLTTQLWHERMWQDPVTGSQHAHRASCHAYAFGKHLVGDRLTGQIYNMDSSIYDDAGAPLVRIRIAPHISNEQMPIFFSQLRLDAQVGVGPSIPLVDGNGNPRDPQATLELSDDGGNTYGRVLTASLGAAGKYRQEVVWRRLGSALDRVFRVTVSDPVAVAWTNAYIDSTPGTEEL